MAPSAVSTITQTVITATGEQFPLYSSSPDSNVAAPAVQAPTSDYQGYHHVTWWVGNAKQAASYYITRMGFKPIAKSDLTTGSRYVASHVVENGNVRFVFSSPLLAPASTNDLPAEQKPSLKDQSLIEEMHRHLEKHGDAVKDVAFAVDSVRAVFESAIEQGASEVERPRKLCGGDDGYVLLATIRTYGDTTHTFVEKNGYSGIFLPGYNAVIENDPLEQFLPSCQLQNIDHCVGNQGWNEMEEACD
jgi:4-hydroxyphenylpyruvate dioxygenase